MVLRKTPEDEEKLRMDKEKAIQETLKSNRFQSMIFEIQKYLVLQGAQFSWIDYRPRQPHLLGNVILIVGKSDTLYIDVFLKELGPTINYYYEDQNKSSYNYVPIKTSRWWSIFNHDSNEKLNKIVRKLNNEKEIGVSDSYAEIHVKSDLMKYYIIFWNLFLAAMDDDIYNEQLATVAELAACFGFDEPMMRDWCRAVEYVFAGNKLSEDCDLECETVEGARFFLHKEE